MGGIGNGIPSVGYCSAADKARMSSDKLLFAAKVFAARPQLRCFT
jgi:hypothetical protein